jgi:hypothetical protein
LEDQDVDRKMGSEWALSRLAGRVWGDSVGSGPVAGYCECGDKHSGSGTTELVTSN